MAGRRRRRHRPDRSLLLPTGGLHPLHEGRGQGPRGSVDRQLGPRRRRHRDRRRIDSGNVARPAVGLDRPRHRVVVLGERKIRAVDISSLTLNRLSLYLRCLRTLQEQGIERISSQKLADQFNLSAPLIRKDLAQFGEFGIRGTGYEVEHLIDRLHSALGLDQQHPLLVVGMGSLGTALARYLDFNDATFRVVAVLDNDPAKVGRVVGGLTIRHTDELEEIVREHGVEIGVLTVPAEAAQTA
ncbi:MAG: redox-sensing transcriptional repressor Rex, partial [Acidobacteria bacterium]